MKQKTLALAALPHYKRYGCQITLASTRVSSCERLQHFKFRGEKLLWYDLKKFFFSFTHQIFHALSPLPSFFLTIHTPFLTSGWSGKGTEHAKKARENFRRYFGNNFTALSLYRFIYTGLCRR